VGYYGREITTGEKMTKVKTQARIVGEHFFAKTSNRIRYMGYHGRAPVGLNLLECNILSTGTNVLSFTYLLHGAESFLRS
jgi:hypothetical protein